MPYSNLIVSNLNNNNRPAYEKATIEDQYYAAHAQSEIYLPVPRISLARIRHAITAAKQAFVTFNPANNA